MQADSIRKISLLHNLNLRLFISFTKFCHSQGVKHSRQVYENSKGIEKTSLPCTIINTVAMHLKKSVLFIYMQFPIINIHTLSSNLSCNLTYIGTLIVICCFNDLYIVHTGICLNSNPNMFTIYWINSYSYTIAVTEINDTVILTANN